MGASSGRRRCSPEERIFTVGHVLWQAKVTFISPHLPHADLVVGVAGEQSLAVSGPGERGDLGRLGAGGAGDLGPEVLHQVLALQVPDLDAGPGGGAQPVPVGREGEAVDGVAAVQGVQVLPVIQIPEHGAGVLATAGAQGTVGGECDGVKISGVADVVGLQLAVGQVPHLDVLVPPARHDDRVGVVRGEPTTKLIFSIT